MQRFTISLDDDLAERFDQQIAAQGYVNRSEAVRDMIRLRLDSEALAGDAPWCVATVSYVYDHHDRRAAERLVTLQHDHHDLVVSSLHTHLDHANCLESVVLRGPAATVRACAEEMLALRGIRNGNIHLVALTPGDAHVHAHGDGTVHRHLKPVA